MGEEGKNAFEKEREIFFAALEKVTEESRAHYLEETCGDDGAMLARVREMLKRHGEDETETFLKPQEITTVGGLMEREGSLVGNYKLVRKLGEGGFGVVWMAKQEEPVQRKVALKLIKPGMDSAEVIARFGAEKQALAVMDHPNIAKVFDAGATESGRPYFVMELAEGVPITDFCDREKLTTKERLELFAKVCGAVQHAHQKAVIHRDLKPSNILVVDGDEGPVPKVIDFGIAKAIGEDAVERTAFTAHGQLVGTPQYMSPEQAGMGATADIDTRSDVYSLGVVLYELLAGSPPFDVEALRSAGFEGMCRMIREDEPPKPSTKLGTLDEGARTEIATVRQATANQLGKQLHGDLDWVVMKALEKDRARRYGSAGDLAEDIGRHMRQEPVSAGPPSARYRIGKFVRRKKGQLVAGGIAAVGLAMAGMVWLDAEFERRERAGEVASRASALLDEADRLMAANAAADFEDTSHFFGAAELGRRLRGMADFDDAGDFLLARRASFLDSLAEETKARNLVSAIEEASLRQFSRLGDAGGHHEEEGITEAFQNFGFDPATVSIEGGVSRFMALREAVRSRAIAGLANLKGKWKDSEPDKAGRLSRIIERSDPDPWRRSMRKAAEEEDTDTLVALSRAPELSGQPTETILELYGALRAKASEANRDLLRRAQRENPTSFWTNFWLAMDLLATSGGENDRDLHILGDFNVGGQRPPGFRFRGGAAKASPAMLEGVGFIRTAVAARPDLGTGWLMLGNALTKVGRPEEATAMIRQVIRLGPDNPASLIISAMALLNQKQYREALDLSNQVEELDPDNLLVHFYRSVSLAHLGRYDEARSAAEKASLDLAQIPDQSASTTGFFLFSKPDHPLTMIAIIASGRGDHKEALRACELAIQDEPEESKAYLFRGMAYSNLGLSTLAILSYQKAIELDPESAEGHMFLGFALLGRNDYEGALSCLRVAHKLDPENPEPLVNLGAVLSRMNEDEEVLPYLEKALAIDPDFPMAHFNMGQILLRRGDIEGAANCFRKAIELDPAYQDAKDSLATIEVNSADPIQAIEMSRRLIEENPDEPEQHAKLGELLSQIGKFKEATDSFERVLNLDPNHANAHSNLGFVCAQQGKLTDALDHCRRALEIDPKHEVAYQNLATVLMLSGKFDEALESCRKAIRIIPDSGKAHGNLAKVYYDLGRLDEAVVSCRKSLSLDPNLAAPHRTLGAALFKLGKVDDAAQSYRRSVELDPKLTVATAHIELVGGEVRKAIADALLLTRKAYGEEHPKTAAALSEISAMLLANGRPSDALPLANQAVELSRKIYPEKHEETVKAMFILGTIFSSLPGREKENVEFMEKLLPLCKEVLGPEHEMTLGSMTNLAGHFMMSGRLDEATVLEGEALALKRRVLPKDHRFLKTALSMMAMLYDKSGRRTDATRLGKEVLAWTREHRGVNHPEAHAAMADLMGYLEAEGKFEEVGKLVSEQSAMHSREGQRPPPNYQGILEKVADQLATGWEIPGGEVADYYAEKKRSLTVNAVHLGMIKVPRSSDPLPTQREKVEALRDEIEGGRPFEKVAEAFSVAQGGDRGWVKPGYFQADLDEKIFSMKPGDVGIYEGGGAFWLLKVEDRKDGEIPSLEEAREEIEDALREDKKEALLQQWREEAKVILDKENGTEVEG